MSNKRFFKEWKTLRCDLCGEYDTYPNVAEITFEDFEGHCKIRVCQKCEERIYDTLSILSARKDNDSER